MLPNPEFLNKPPEFWANVKLLNQRLRYQTAGVFIIPTAAQITSVFNAENLNTDLLLNDGRLTDYGAELIRYLQWRGEALISAKNYLMKAEEAAVEYNRLKRLLHLVRPEVMNKQKGEKRAPAFLTCITNGLIEYHLDGLPYNYDPKELTAFTNNGRPVYTLSRRVDGAFPAVINPIGIIEIKEYYYTTTFGSRIADGVYETQLDGWEIADMRKTTGINVEHILIIDAYNTWWLMGIPYLCRLVDAMQMGLVDEVIFGREVLERIPLIVERWKEKYRALRL